jgi:hypothetical protein
MDFLRSIQRARLPLRIDDHEEIVCVRLLRAAHLVEAIVKEAHVAGEDDYVLIEEITPRGRAELARPVRT